MRMDTLSLCAALRYSSTGCYQKTSVLDAWSSKRHELYHEAVAKRRELFPNLIDDSGVTNDVDDLED